MTDTADVVEPVFGVRARFPLGTFKAHRDGRTEEWPSTLRLFEALTHAAGKGSCARVDDGQLRPDEASVQALTWFEEHPPQALHVPRRVTNASTTAIYRHEGVLDRDGAGAADRKTLRSAESTALGGAVGWLWSEEPPDTVATRLADLAADVAYLGEAECPAVLEVLDKDQLAGVADLTPTHVLVRTGELQGVRAGGVPVPTPIHGRFAALERAYADRYPRKRPTAAQDKFTLDQRPTSPAPSTEGVESAHYETCVPEQPPTPWSQVFLLPVGTRTGAHGDRLAPVADVPPVQRTPWAVAMHRALVAQKALQYTASPVVTGRYPRVTGALTGPDPRQIRRHTNRVAIQILPSGIEVGGRRTRTVTFAVLVPPSVTVDEAGMIAEALTQVGSVYDGALGRFDIDRAGDTGDVPRRLSADQVWSEPASGMRRFWRTSPVAVPETRRQRGAAGGWSIADSCLLSVGFAFKDALVDGELPSGAEGYALLRDAVAARGVRVLDVSSVRERPTAYVHKLPPGVVAQPYRATLDLGDLLAPTAMVAVGQTRHLGGGLLRPVDVPVDLAAEWVGGAR